MKVIPFIVQNAAEAMEQIHQQLGPDAMIVSIRKVPATGLSRLWKKYGRVEVLAGLPDEVEESVAPELPAPALPEFPVRPRLATEQPAAAVLDKMGLLPLFAERVLDRADSLRGGQTEGTLSSELELLHSALNQSWRSAPPLDPKTEGPHVFIGPAGGGKTTALCKWLTQTVLVEGRNARVWRLDSSRANTAESLSVHCEILGVPEERGWRLDSHQAGGERWFVDLPGGDWQDRTEMAQLGAQLRQFAKPTVHLVLNAAYDVPLLFAQIRAFSRLPIHDLVATHLDEETRWSKLWNLILGTNYSLRFLGAGQNIPGQFIPATPELLIPREFPRQIADSAPSRLSRLDWQRSC